MEDYREVGVPDFIRQMKSYLDGRIEVRSYREGIFALMKRRATLTEEEFRIIQTAFSDADDYDPIVRLEHTITEPELRRRVAKSLDELASPGYGAVQVDSSSTSS